MESRLRASQQQFAIILDFMESHGDLSKPQPGLQGRLNNEWQWNELTELLNSVGVSGVRKPADRWKRVWSDWKTKTKKKAAVIHRDTQGGGKLLNPQEKRVLRIIGMGAATGHEEIETVYLPTATSPEDSISTSTSPGTTTATLPVACNVAAEESRVMTPSIPGTPESSGVEVMVAFSSQATNNAAMRRDVNSQSCVSSLHRQSVFGQRRARRRTMFKRAASEYVHVEQGRLRLEEKRLELEHEREMERLRVEALRIQMEDRRTAAFESITHTAREIVGLISQYINDKS